MAILIYVFFIAIFLVVPLPAKLILLAINLFVPDPIPVLDEVIMAISVLKKINTLETVWEFFDEHRYLIPVVAAAMIGLIILLYKLVF